MATEEHVIQNEIRNDLTEEAICWRAQVGKAWQGDIVEIKGQQYLANLRRFDTGLPPGFSDLFGMVDYTVTQADVGKKIARPFFLEVKRPKGKIAEKQEIFIKSVRAWGALAGFAHSVAEARKILFK